MKKILLSGGMIVLVGALVAGATIAFYNDTETSAGNIFTAGSIDLKVDHLKQTYRGVDCQTCIMEVKSDTTDMVIAKNGLPYGPTNAVIVSPTSITTSGSNWDANIPLAEWIWPTDPVTQEDVDNDVIYTFEKKFVWFGPLVSATINFAVAADNSYEVWLNGVMIKADTNENNHAVADIVTAGVVTPQINQGENILQFKVKNWAQPGAPIINNPGGLKYKLTINGNCDQNSEFLMACRLWTDKDLGEGDTFFSFGDIKPGDWGTNVISLHVDDNEAYACMFPMDPQDLENTCNDAEGKANDPSCPDLDDDGELGSQLSVVVWSEEGTADGEHQSGEHILYQGSINGLNTEKLTVPQGETGYVGLAWCAGSIPDMTDESDGVVCNASGMTNTAQSDSFAADLLLYAVQSRNNSEFSCDGVPAEPGNVSQQ